MISVRMPAPVVNRGRRRCRLQQTERSAQGKGPSCLAASCIPSRDTCAALPAAAVSGLLSADIGDSEEDEPSGQRRTFVSLTGTSLFGAILADTRSPADAIEPFAAVLATYA